jgi:hypothetical protein
MLRVDRLLAACRAWASAAFTSPDPSPAAPSVPWPAYAGAAALGAWIFAYKLRAFLDLTTTSDLYQFTQLATTWLDGRFLEDNCYGYHLAIHTYLFCPILAVLAWPLGSVGLLAAVGLAAGAGFIATVKLLRTLQVPATAACAFAALVTAMPLTLHVYRDTLYGFHVELLLPAMAMWLAYFLTRRRWAASLATALVIVSVKEDAPLLAFAIAALVYAEDGLRDAFRARAGGGFRSAVNAPAIVAAGLGMVALPLLLHVIQLNAPGAGTIGGFDRIRIVGDIRLGDGGSLFAFALENLGGWLTADATVTWLCVAVVASFGLVLLRPHALLVGIVLTIVSWLMKDSPLWAPRFAPSLGFLQAASVFAFASAWTVTTRLARVERWGRALAAGAAVLALAVAVEGYRHQAARTPGIAEVYTVRPTPTYTGEEIAQANGIFAIYRRESRRSEPVIASSFLFRYAHDRNLYWVDRLAGAPEPIWILWDDGAEARSVDAARYTLRERRGRFSLYKRAGA